MGADEGREGRPVLVELVTAGEPYPSPIVIDRGGGAYVRLPVPGAAVEQLGGPERLRERLANIAASGPYASGTMTPQAAAALTAQHERLLGHLEALDPEFDPIHVDPGKGWSLTFAVPEAVVAGLGGTARLDERVSSILGPRAHRSAAAGPAAARRVAAHYEEFLGQVEVIVAEPER